MDINNNLIIQYGKINKTSNEIWCNLPISYTTLNYSVVDTPYFDTSAPLNYTWEITNKEITRFHMYSDNFASYYYVHWITIGY